MRKLSLFVSIFAIILLVSACGGNGKQAAEPVVETEEDQLAFDLFKGSGCISCHAADLSGNMGERSNLLQVGSRLSAEEIAGVIKNGKGMMPAQNLEDDKIQQISVWLAKQK